MRRQSLRKLFTLISLLLFPITIYYFSPYLIIDGAIKGIVSGSFILFSTLFVTSIFFGRLFCGYICPMSGLQECLKLVKNKKAKGGKLNFIRWAIWIPWITSIVVMFILTGGIKEVQFTYMTTNGISLVEPMAYVIYYGVILLVVVLNLTAGNRAFCNYVCWISPFMVLGTKVNNVLKTPSLRLSTTKEKCIGCKKCTTACPMNLDVEAMAKSGNMAKSECILCGECIDTCPKKVIRYKF